jgi:CubicO group peptidase (beta-lactamase class C family)
MKKFLKVFIIILFLLSVIIWVTGYSYLFKTLVYTFPNIDDLTIFEKREIPNGAVQEWPLSSRYNKIQLPEETDAENLRNESVAYLIVQHDSIIYEQYWDGYDKQSESNSFSMSKSIVGLLTGIAVEEKLLSLEDPVGKYIPSFNTPENSSLRVIDLLTMTSGLNWVESYSNPLSKTTEAYYGKHLEEQVKSLKVIQKPGSVYSYKSCNTLLLSMVIAKATGITVSEYASEKLWKPLGASQAAYWSLDNENGIEKGYCCFYSSARDFARIGQLLLDSGKWHGKQIISWDYLKRSVTPIMTPDETGAPVDFYGWHWWITTIDEKPVYYARGILGQYIIVIPDIDMVVVRLGKKRGEKLPGNRYSDMITYTTGALSAAKK